MKHFGSYRGDRVANAKIRHRDNLAVYLIKKREKIVKRSAYRFASAPLGAMNTTSGRLEKRLTNDSELLMAWPFRNFWSSSRLAARVSALSSEAGVTGGRTVTQKRTATSGKALTHVFPNVIFPTSEHVHRHLGSESLQAKRVSAQPSLTPSPAYGLPQMRVVPSHSMPRHRRS